MNQQNAIKLEVQKEFPVPVPRLYQAWIDPETLKQWWHPMGNTLQQATTTPEPGGTVQYVFANEQGAHSFTINGTYKEVEDGKRLVYTWNWKVPEATVGDSDFVLQVKFDAAGNGSRLSVTQENFSAEEAVQPHREGWEKALNELHHFLAQQA
jgi:uncharacterized protein YndB with AHSA1/START domain